MSSGYMDRMAAGNLAKGERECPFCRGTGAENDGSECGGCFGMGFHPAD